MKIAVLSGKGGTGKTTVAASFAMSVCGCRYIDCDVEEPNGYIFLNPLLSEETPVQTDVPHVDQKSCTGCGECAKVCRFNAIACVKGKIVVFPELCHGCGACIIACGEKALSRKKRKIGVVELNRDHTFIQGKLNPGEPISVPVIKKVKEFIRDDMTVIIDCPPGASCTVVESVEDADYGILVSEPTPFGLHDLKIAVELLRKIKIPFGVIVNKAVDDSVIIDGYCIEEGIDILMRIPFSIETARAYSIGKLRVCEDEAEKRKFAEVFGSIKRRVAG